jgi:hypothetical protein
MSKMGSNEPLNSIDEVVGAPRCTRVAAYTTDYVFRGDVHHSISERLLDVLNEGSVVDQADLPGGFLLLTDVEIFPSDGEKSTSVPECLLNKSSIFFIGEKNIYQAEPPPVIHYRSSLFTEKIPIQVNILMTGLTVAGRSYIIEWERTISAVNTEQLFLPLTKVKVLVGAFAGDNEFEFGAVNKNHIISIIEAERH